MANPPSKWHEQKTTSERSPTRPVTHGDKIKIEIEGVGVFCNSVA
jgi:2-keto-4-pentenoate hydratase/2-oxohepta-3-ene-1,7-dioic acid hydratase in catechol pathway